MIWKVAEQIAYLSRFYDIAAGDVIAFLLVSACQHGDDLHCEIEVSRHSR